MSFHPKQQGLPPNQVSAHQIGYASRTERLRCLGLFRGTLNHAEGDAWSRHTDPGRIAADFKAYMRDPSSYIRGNPGGGDPPSRGEPPSFAAKTAPPQH